MLDLKLYCTGLSRSKTTILGVFSRDIHMSSEEGVDNRGLTVCELSLNRGSKCRPQTKRSKNNYHHVTHKYWKQMLLLHWQKQCGCTCSRVPRDADWVSAASGLPCYVCQVTSFLQVMLLNSTRCNQKTMVVFIPCIGGGFTLLLKTNIHSALRRPFTALIMAILLPTDKQSQSVTVLIRKNNNCHSCTVRISDQNKSKQLFVSLETDPSNGICQNIEATPHLCKNSSITSHPV